MGKKLLKFAERPGSDEESYMFQCPGCGCGHRVTTKRDSNEPKSPLWTWNGSLEKPTFNPSILTWTVINDERKNICHSYVIDGQIRFLGDCHHELKNQVVDLPDWENV